MRLDGFADCPSLGLYVNPTLGLEYWIVQVMIGPLGNYILGQAVIQMVGSGEVGKKRRRKLG